MLVTETTSGRTADMCESRHREGARSIRSSCSRVHFLPHARPSITRHCRHGLQSWLLLRCRTCPLPNGIRTTTMRRMTERPKPVVCSFESRRSAEMCSLIERHGGIAVAAPSMREIPIGNNPAALAFVKAAIDDCYPFVVLLTGVGTDALLEVARSQGQEADLIAALNRTTLIIRGPKPAAALARIGLKAAVRAPEPNTWRELLGAIDDSGLAIRGQRLAVQEYGISNQRFCDALRERGAIVDQVPVYRWALPEDTGPLERSLQQISDGAIDVVLFTSANQVSSVLGVADSLGLLDAVRASFTSGRTRIASIGPTCSEALTDQGLPVHVEASPPKMGQLVRVALEA